MTRLSDTNNLDDRPRPIKDAADKLTRWLGVAGSLVLALVGWGILTAAQGNAVTGLLGAIPGAVNAVTTLLVAFGIVRSSEHRVTPLSDPRDNELRPLVALPPNSKLVPKTGPQGDSGLLGGLTGLAAREDTARAAGSQGPFAAHLMDPTPALVDDTDDEWSQPATTGNTDDVDDAEDCDRLRTVSDPLPEGERLEVRNWGGDTIHHQSTPDTGQAADAAPASSSGSDCTPSGGGA